MISLLNAAGAIAVFAAVQALWLGNLSRNVHIFRSYAFVSIYIAVFLLASSAWYSASTLEQAAHAAKWQTFGGLGHTVAVIWLIGHMSGLMQKRAFLYPLLAYTLLLSALVIVAAITPPLEFIQNYQIIGTQELLLQNVTAYAATGNHSGLPINLLVMLAYIVCGYGTALIYRQGDRFSSLWLASYLIIQTVYLGNRLAVDLNLADSLLPIGFPPIWLLLVISVCFGREHQQAISTLREQEEDLTRRAYYDDITGLPNELWLREELGRRLKSRREGRLLVLLHIHDFRAIQRTFGNNQADQLLSQLSERVRGTLSPGDLAARLQDCTFCVVRNGYDQALTAEQQSINSVITNPYFIGSQRIDLAFHLGIIDASLPDSAENALYRADLALQDAMKKGPNKAVFFDDVLAEQIERDRNLQEAFPKALAAGEFTLHFQPKVDATGRCIGAEALLRWQREKEGLVSPAIFIPLAERSGFMPELGSWVIAEACRFLCRLRQQDTILPGRLSINVSPWQLREGTLAANLHSALKESGVSPSQLEVELTETSLVESVEHVREQLATLREQGITIAVDDFGTGYSSLAYLQHLPLDVLKIDKQFVDNLHSTRGRQLVEAIIDIGEALTMEIVAEGVESADQWEPLKTLGCQCFQGYYFSRPLPEAEFVKWLAKHSEPSPATS